MIKIISEEEFINFSKGRSDASFFQSIGFKRLKESYNETMLLVGYFEANILKAASLFIKSKPFLENYRLYAPRGFLIDYEDIDLLKRFTLELKTFAKNEKVYEIKIDPNIIYRYRSKEGDILNDETNDAVINNLKETGYIHGGFHSDIVYSQSRWNYHLDLDMDIDALYQSFNKNTRKNILSAQNKGVLVKEITSPLEIDNFTEVLNTTGLRKDFKVWDASYYKKVKEAYGDDVYFFLAYIDKNKYISLTKEKLLQEKENLEHINRDIANAKLSKKLENKRNTSLNLIKKLEEELKAASSLKDITPIGALVSYISGDYFLSLSSGTSENYKDFNPKYALYDAHIRKAYELGIKHIDFYGIIPDFDKHSKDYGILEFKQGFGGYIVELIGEFTLRINLRSNIHKALQSIKRRISK